ncbi:helix-turn-helix domain-containing protein [Rhodoferax sediminis]|uniref:helix-turn-helix domain-containing protein n=1 Tax=Rhodoferax sediminis TaxID=2509614 RepID=UPI00143DE7DC|nr:helix-turn-helix domain-containing protein [Rhodoferax sediminis]
MILLAAQGWQNKDIAAQVDLDRRQVALWRQRFLGGGIDALRQDAPRSGRTLTLTPRSALAHSSGDAAPKPVAGTHWSTRTLAEHLGLSATTIRRVWRRNGVKPHLQRSFKREALNCNRWGQYWMAGRGQVWMEINRPLQVV